MSVIFLTGFKMVDNDSESETFDLDDRQAEIVPALQQSHRGNLCHTISIMHAKSVDMEI